LEGPLGLCLILERRLEETPREELFPLSTILSDEVPGTGVLVVAFFFLGFLDVERLFSAEGISEEEAKSRELLSSLAVIMFLLILFLNISSSLGLSGQSSIEVASYFNGAVDIIILLGRLSLE
jgi:hypothetical protein